MNGSRGNVPALQGVKDAHARLVALPADDDAVRLSEQVSALRPALPVEEEAVSPRLIPHRLCQLTVHCLKLYRVFENMIFRCPPTLKHIGQQGTLKQRASIQTAADQDHALLISSQRVLLPVETAQCILTAEQVQIFGELIHLRG